MTLAELTVRMHPNTSARYLIEDRYNNRVGRLLFDKSDEKWYLVSLLDDCPIYLRDYEVITLEIINGDMYIMVSWRE